MTTIGIAIHVHAAAFHAGPSGPAGTLLKRGRNWQDLGSKLAALLNPVPHDDVVRDDLTALARLLPTVAPFSGPGRAHKPDPTARQTGAVLGGAVALMTEVANYNAQSFARLTVYVPTRTLTGDEITDHPELVRARLNGKLAPAPKHQRDEVTKLYGELGIHPSPAAALGLSWVAAETGRAIDVEPISVQVDA